MAPLAPSQLDPDSEGRFEAVYRTHVRDVYGFSLGMLGNAEDAEDVTQTTFLNAYRALKRGEEVRNLRAWLLAIAHNVCRQRFRTAARRPREVELDPESAEALVDEDAPTATEIRAAMGQLSFNQRTVLVLREIEGLSYEEISQAMGISLSAVETLLFRARRALREQLEAADHDLGCHAVERLISLQLDGKLSRQDRGLLRAHLRTCSDCARLARSQRARKRIMPSLIAVPLPAGLSGAFGTVGGGSIVSAKVAALAASVALVGAGALVETGVIPTPGSERRVEAAASEPSSPAFTEPVWAPSASLRRVFDEKAEKAPAKPVAAKPKRKKQAPSARTGAGTTAVATSPSSASAGGSSAPRSGGSSGPLPVTPPAPPAIPDVVGEAGSKLPPLPASVPDVAPSLPPVNVPTVPGSLP